MPRRKKQRTNKAAVRNDVEATHAVSNGHDANDNANDNDNDGLSHKNDLMQMVQRGDVDQVRRLLEQQQQQQQQQKKKNRSNNDSLFEQTSDDGSSLLHVASKAGHVDILRLLLDHGGYAHIDVTNNEHGQSPLHVACANGHLEAVRCLLAPSSSSQTTADVNLYDSEYRTPLLLAIHHRHSNIVHLLMEHGADVSSRPRHCKVPLIEAARHGLEDVVETFLSQPRAKANIKDMSGCTPLYVANINGHAGVVKQLIGAGADVDAVMRDGSTALEDAVKAGHADVVACLLDGDVSTDRCDESGRTALHHAAMKNKLAGVLQLLIDGGAEVEARDVDGCTALYHAVKHGCHDIVEILLQHNADINDSRRDGLTAVQLACDNGDVRIVRLLLENGGDCSGTSWSASSAMHIACEHNNVPMIEELISLGQSVHGPRADLNTPLDVACKTSNFEAARTLLHHGANPSEGAHNGNYLLCATMWNKDSGMVELLLRHGVSIHEHPNQLRTIGTDNALEQAERHGEEYYEGMLRYLTKSTRNSDKF